MATRRFALARRIWQRGAMKQQGVNRVVMAVQDIDVGRAFYEELLDCTFHPANEEDAAAFGVKVLMSWDGGIELVAPIEGAGSHVEQILAAKGEGLIGVVWAVPDADKAKEAAERLGVPAVFTLSYDQDQIDANLQGRFTTYHQHFLMPSGPLGDAQVLVGDFETPD
ncbi:MAG: VOC family protein [Actinomycetota bacterium]